tara:strand:- start:1493 stop:1690 length:198 start_codon:yes stop_codon:yes gene_type:complete
MLTDHLTGKYIEKNHYKKYSKCNIENKNKIDNNKNISDTMNKELNNLENDYEIINMNEINEVDKL